MTRPRVAESHWCTYTWAYKWSVPVPQVTIYLDAETEARMKVAAKEAEMPQSRWIAELIKEKTAKEWPESVVRLAGSWADAPTTDELRGDDASDVPREPL